ncbi:MAG: hypothetical protein ABIF87_01225 [Pseudomonadota bacterium]
MQIGNALESVNPEKSASSVNIKSGRYKPPDLSFNNSEKNVPNAGRISHGSVVYKPDYKEAATEMLAEERVLGEFEDKDWIGVASDLQIGPDIRYALTSTNSNFLKRILWGPLTSAEFREVTHRLREIEREGTKSQNILKGQIIDIDG